MQSDVYQHTQLNWILSCFSQFSELSRMTQFKVKRIQNCVKNNNVGLFNDVLQQFHSTVSTGQNNIIQNIQVQCSYFLICMLL